jgi:hypothetical protein
MGIGRGSGKRIGSAVVALILTLTGSAGGGWARVITVPVMRHING